MGNLGAFRGLRAEISDPDSIRVELRDGSGETGLTTTTSNPSSRTC
jgi:hypothetical protein